MLAAAGLSNKEIGHRLFMSHRTVGAHLYQIFPKLGVTSRAALRDALADLPEPGKPGLHTGLPDLGAISGAPRPQAGLATECCGRCGRW